MGNKVLPAHDGLDVGRHGSPSDPHNHLEEPGLLPRNRKQVGEMCPKRCHEDKTVTSRAQHSVLLGCDPLPSGSCLMPPVCWPSFPTSCQAALPLSQGRSCFFPHRVGRLRKREMALTLAHLRVDPAPPSGMLSSVPHPDSLGHTYCDSLHQQTTLLSEQVPPLTLMLTRSPTLGLHQILGGNTPHTPFSETDMFRCWEVTVPKDLPGEMTQG